VLNRVADQRAIWSQQIRVLDEDTPAFSAMEPIIAQIAGDYGVIVRDQVQRQRDNRSNGSATILPPAFPVSRSSTGCARCAAPPVPSRSMLACGQR